MFYSRCLVTGDRKNYIKAESNGWRSTIYYPGGGHYKGHWKNGQHDWYGVKTNKTGLVYDGQWKNGKRHGHGTMRQNQNDGTSKKIYIGDWRDDMKWGEGKQFYKNGIYYGFWKRNRRSGPGIKWYNDGKIYLGEWDSDVKHGIGVYLYANGNRYEGHFARGFKNGEGTYFHNNTGQIQKGMWEDNVCKTSMMMDGMRQSVVKPTPYTIPPLKIPDPDGFICELFWQYINNSKKPKKSLGELNCLKFIAKMNRFAKFEEKATSNSKVEVYNLKFACVCKPIEQIDLLEPV